MKTDEILNGHITEFEGEEPLVVMLRLSPNE